MSIKNFYSLVKEDKKIHNPQFGKLHFIALPARILILGPSSSGKSNTLIRFIQATSGTFEKIVIVLKNAEEPLYNLLKKIIPETEILEDKVPPFEDFEGFGSSLLVFDDMILSKNPLISEYFIRGRKMGITICYLSQSYFMVPKIIRQQCQYLIIKKLATKRDLSLILSEYSSKYSVDQVYNIYQQALKGDFTNFLLIDTINDQFRNSF